MENRKAYHNWEIEDVYTAGLMITSAEVKSIIQHKCAFMLNTFAYIKEGNEVVLKGLHFSKPIGIMNLESFVEDREIKLLLNKKEIQKINKKLDLKGYSLIPIRLKKVKRFYKLEIGIGKGKNKQDKKESIKEKDIARETQKILKENY